MNKLFTKIVGAALGLTMAIGVGVAVGNSREASQVFATAGDELAICQGTGSGYGARRTLTDSHSVGWVLASGQSEYLGANKADSHNKVKPTAVDLPVVKGVLSTATTGTTGYYFYFTTTAVSNVGSIEFSYTANSGNTSATGYVLSSATAASSGSATWTKIDLDTGSGLSAQGVSLGSSGTFTFSFSTETTAKYYGFVIKTTSFKRLTGGTIKLLEGDTSSASVTGITKKTAPTKTQYVSGESFDPAGLVVTVSYDSTDPEDVAYTGNESDFDWSPKTITADGNVEIQYKTYSTMKVTQAVTLVTVTNVTGVASHPSEVAVDGTIDPDEVVLNVTYSNSTSGTVKATSVTCDTSVAKTGVTATATYSEATGTKTATFTIDVVLVPGYDLVTSAGSLRNGASVVIYSYAKQKIMGNSAASALRTGISLAVAEADVAFIASDDIPANTEVLTLVQSGSHWELKTSGNEYLSLTSDANAANISDNPDTTDNTTEWDISFSGNNATIQSVAYSARYLEANTSIGNFGCYKGTQSKVQLYLLRNTDPYFSINMTSMYLRPLGTQTLTLTAHNGASDTVTWSTGNASIASIPNSSTGMSVVVTGVAEGKTTITATFGDPLTYEALVCAVEVLDLEPYVNVGVTTFTKTTTKPSGGWAGTYLIGDSTGKTILDGSLSPLPGGGTNYASLASLPDSVEATSEMISKSFTIKATETAGEYTIRSNFYYYIGNTTTNNGMDTSIGESYNVTISDSGVMTMNGTTLAYNTESTYRFYGNLTDNIRAATLWRADGEMREITSTLSNWYSTVKAQEYLVCSASGTGSKINWSKLEETAAELSSDDLDTLENMAAKPSENGGNYLEDLISDYDYLVAVKHYDDFLGREAAGTLSVAKANNIVLFAITNSNVTAIIVVVSLVSLTAIGGYFFLRKRKED
jgi:hypothetical protein